ncbi:MAG TPA: hypothetical protein VMH86_11905 [Rhizomicrobium sp.]|nr:hypothetical protein [Rhizomicrobium sp.]
MDGVSHELDGAKIEETAARLAARVGERFPGSGLAAMCADLVKVAAATREPALRTARPNIGLRAMAAAVVAAVLALALYVTRLLDWSSLAGKANVYNFMQGIDAAVNLLILTAGGIWFFVTLEARIKRRHVQRALFELRSYAHVIDMRQLTKDPTVILSPGSATSSSPRRGMTRFELTRYLEYCAEMLSLLAKLAALHAGATTDAEILAAVNEVEQLTNNLGRKIWQKIMILGQLDERATAG